MNPNDQSQSYSGINTDPGPNLSLDYQESTRLTNSPLSGLVEDNANFVPPRSNDGKLHALDLVGDNYEIISLIGVGGMGYVYRVRHRILQKQYAMKTLSSQHVSEIAWRRLQVEAQAIARMNHPNIIGIHNLGLHEDRLPYYVMDLLDGESLADRLKRGSLTLTQALPIFIEVCRGLAYAHKKGIIHRDIKPGNIILLKEPDSSGARVKIVDLGIAKLSGASDPDNQNLTCIGEVFGSPYYMSPEQCEGKRIDARSDIYSVGCTIFEALVGYPPFRGNNPVQTMVMHQSHEPSTMSAASGKDFPDEIEELVYQLLAKAPMDRYQSLDKVAEDLQSIAAGREIKSKALFDTHTFFAPEEEKATSKNYTLPIVMAIATVLLIGTAICLVLGMQKNVEKPKVTTVGVKKISTASNTTAAVVAKAKVPEQQQQQQQPFSHLTTDKNGKAVRQFDFGSKNYLGRMFVNGSTEYWEARGSKQFPADSRLELVSSPQLMAKVYNFDRFRADDLFSVRFFQQAMPETSNSNGNDDFMLPENYESDVALALQHMQHMTGIRRLDFIDCPNADDKCITPMNKFSNLSQVRASGTAITGAGLSKLNRLKELSSLTYSHGQQVSTLLNALAGSKKLTDLGLDSPASKSLSLNDLRLIASCTNLTKLDLDNCNISNEGLAIIATLPHLKILYADDNKFDAGCLHSIAKMKSLKCADLQTSTWPRYQELMKKHFPNINTVVVED